MMVAYRSIHFYIWSCMCVYTLWYTLKLDSVRLHNFIYSMNLFGFFFFHSLSNKCYTNMCVNMIHILLLVLLEKMSLSHLTNWPLHFKCTPLYQRIEYAICIRPKNPTFKMRHAKKRFSIFICTRPSVEW